MNAQAHLNSLPTVARQMILEAAEEHGVTVEALLSPQRPRCVAQARQALYAALYDLTWPSGARRFSLPAVARFLNRSDHTSVLHGIRVHKQRMGRAA